MANRTMQAKSAKRQRQRRAWARPLSIASHRVPNSGVIQQYKESAASLGVPEYEIDELIKMVYGRQPFKGTPSGRAEVLQLIKDMRQHIPSLSFFELIDNCYQRALLWYNDDKTVWVITHTDKRRNIFRRSIHYPDKDTACKWFARDRVVWVVNEPERPKPSE